MRRYTEQCLRNLQDKIHILGLEEWDIFIVLGTGLILQLFHVRTLIMWAAVVCVTGFLLLVKKGKQPDAVKHYLEWFAGVKRFSAVVSDDIAKIKGRGFDFKETPAQGILPYSHIEDDILVMADDSLSVGFKVDTPSIESYSEDEMLHYSKRLEGFLNLFPEDLTYQFIFTVDSDTRGKIDQHEKVAESANPIIKGIHKEKIRSFRKREHAHAFRNHNCFLFVNFIPKSFGRSKSGILNSIKKRRVQRKREILRDKERLKSFVRELTDTARASNITLNRLREKRLRALLFRFLNPDRTRKHLPIPHTRTHTTFLNEILTSDIAVDEKQGEYLHFGGFYHKFVSLKMLPEATEPAMLYQLMDFPFAEFDVTITLVAPSKTWGRSKIKRLRQREYGNLVGLTKLINKDAEVKIQQYEHLLEELQQQSQKLFRMQIVVHVYDEDLEAVKQKATEVIRFGAGLHGAEMHDERWGAVMPVFVGSLPGWTREVSRSHLIKTRHVADFLPFFSDFKGSGKAECLFRNTTGGLISFDPFSERLAAYNAIVIGATGSGKSFTINQIVNQYSKNNPIEIFIDIGGSYKRQVLLKDGAYISLGLNEKFTINLFDLPRGMTFSDLPDEEKTQALILKSKTIEQMIGGVDRFSESDQIVQDYIFRTVKETYLRHKTPTLSDFKEMLLVVSENEKAYIRYRERIIGLLGNWLKGGRFGDYTDGRSTVSMDSDVVCFDLKGLSQFEKLQTVMLTVIANVIWARVSGEPGRRKIVVFDECWKLLNDPAAAELISECYRTFRKYGASAISVTQSLNDFIGGRLEDAILGNSHTRFILRQNSAIHVREIVEYFNFNPQEKTLIESLRIKKGEYSEVFFSQSVDLNHISAKVVIEPTSLEYWLATTDPLDLTYFNEIDRRFSQKSVFEKLTICAVDYPQGVGHSIERKDNETRTNTHAPSFDANNPHIERVHELTYTTT